MPSESRRLTFSLDEIRVAVTTYATRVGAQLPGGEIVGVASGPGPEQEVSLLFAVAGEETQRDAGFKTEFLGAALIMHCIEQNIPIPRKARRSLGIRDGVLSLYLNMEEQFQEVTALLSDYYDYDFFGG